MTFNGYVELIDLTKEQTKDRLKDWRFYRKNVKRGIIKYLVFLKNDGCYILQIYFQKPIP